MSEIKVFELTQETLKEAEAYILGHSSQNRIGLWFSRHITFPVNFLMKGSEELLKPLVQWSVMTTVFSFAAALIMNNNVLLDEIKSVVLSLCLFIPMALVMFAVPSTYAYYGVKQEDIDVIVKYLETFNIQEPETINCILSNVEAIHTRIMARVSSYK